MGILSNIVNEDKVEMCPEACCGKPITECKCGPDCEHCDCHSKNAINEGTQGCADCEWIKDETDGDITTCDDCAAEKRQTNEAEKRWKQTSMSPQEAIAKYGKENVKVKKGALRNGDDMVEVFVESYSPGDEYADSDGMVSNCCGAPMMDYDTEAGFGRCGDCKDMAAGESEEEYYESGISRLRELSGITEAPTTTTSIRNPYDSLKSPQNKKISDITNPDDALTYSGRTRGVDDPFDVSGTGHADGIGWSQDELDGAMQGFKDVLGTENQIQINRYLAKLPLTIAKDIADRNGYGTYTNPETGARENPDSLIGGYDHVGNPNYGTDAMDDETIAKIKDPDWRDTFDMKDPKFKNIRPTVGEAYDKLPEPEFQLMKKSLLRSKWYLENEEMDPEMVATELRDVNAMLDAVNRGESEAPLDLDTSVEEEYMSLYNQCAAKLKGAVSNIYGIDHDVLPLDAKPNPDSPYNSGQVEENILPVSEVDNEIKRLKELSGITEAPIEENFIDEMPYGLLDGMTFTDGNPDYDYRGNPMNYGEVDWPEINDRHKDENGNVKPEATIKPEDFAVDDLLPG
jgi:hypothetical protein